MPPAAGSISKSCAATGEVAGLLRAYRAGELAPGPETSEFIEGAILQQSEILAHLPDAFQRWPAAEQTRNNACLAWMDAANTHAAGIARHGGDAVEQGLADQIEMRPTTTKLH